MTSEIQQLQSGVGELLTWFRTNKRDLPWRHGRTFYTALVAEIMLQQTRVEAVKEKYAAFLEKFPTERELALASDDEVMKAWEGLGYYSRARNLKKAAVTLFEEGTPRTWVGVNALAGVGNYTAGALCSIALGLKEPAVDGNVLRILTRFFADESVESDALKKKFTEILRAVYPDDTADFCEALMELGAIVCVPNGVPLCEQCPWKNLCRAHLAGKELLFPVRAEKKQRRVEFLDVYVLTNDGKFALGRREEGLLKGLWEFPNRIVDRPPQLWSAGTDAKPVLRAYGRSCRPLITIERGRSADATAPVAARSQSTGLLSRMRRSTPPMEGACGKGVLLKKKTAKHVFTHVEWHMTGYLISVEKRSPAYVWATAEEIESNYAIPSAFKAFKEWLNFKI